MSFCLSCLLCSLSPLLPVLWFSSQLITRGYIDTGEAMARKMLGDMVESALGKVGITQELVEQYVWNCGCRRRKERMNRIHQWAENVAQNVYGSIVEGRGALLALVNPGTKVSGTPEDARGRVETSDEPIKATSPSEE